jgi:hypothetical protein
MRPSDSLHLAVVLELGEDLEGIPISDDRLAEAARGYGTTVAKPG